MAPSDPATLSWKNLTVYLPAKKSKFGKKKNYNVDPKMILKQGFFLFFYSKGSKVPMPKLILGSSLDNTL